MKAYCWNKIDLKIWIPMYGDFNSNLGQFNLEIHDVERVSTKRLIFYVRAPVFC